MDTGLLIVAQLEHVMSNVPPASKLAPSITFERLVCHQDIAFVICMTPQDVTPILLLAGHHLYSWSESVLNVGFSMKNAKVKPVIQAYFYSLSLFQSDHCLQHVVLVSIAC